MLGQVLNDDEQFAAQGVLTYAIELFTVSPKETFTREEVLVTLNCIRTDAELFDPDVVIAYEMATDDAVEEMGTEG